MQVENVRTALHTDRTRVVIDLSAPPQGQVSSGEGSKRFELLIPDGAMSTRIRQRLFVGTLVSAASHERVEEGLRLTFILSQPLQAKTFYLKPYLSRGDRIVIDFYNPPPVTGTAADLDEAPPADQAAANPGPASRPARAAPRHTERNTFDLTGTWEHEWALQAGGASTGKFESNVQPRVEMNLASGVRLTALGRIRGDTAGDLGPAANSANNHSGANGPLVNSEHAELTLRELYLDGRSGDILWRLGKQQVVWGQADGIKVMDVVNPQSFREFILDDFDDSRIALWTANVEVLLGDAGSVQLLWIPDTTYHELAEAGTTFEFSSPLYVPRRPAGLAVRQLGPERPDDLVGDSDAGLRYSAFWRGWDVTLNYLYHYQDLPVPYQSLANGAGGPLGLVTPQYERNHLAGATLSNVFGALTLRSELVYSSDTYHVSSDFSARGIGSSAELSTVVGLDWQWDAQDTLLSAQWFQSHLPDHDRDIVRTGTEHTLSLLYQRDFLYDTWKFRSLGLYSLDRGDRWINLKLSHMFRDNLELWLGGDFFGGTRSGLYGQFSSRDRILLGMELGF
ncbi:MAG: DUF1302 family protein [Halioglobus sp.]|nr:DUF1302 family protein [Halioglobus sp.]